MSTTNQENNTTLKEILEVLIEEGADGFAPVLEWLLNMSMKVGNQYKLDDPFPKERQPDPALNIIQQALCVRAHLKINPNEY